MSKLGAALFACLLLPACGTSPPNPGGAPACNAGGFGCICVSTSCTCAGLERCDSICGDHCVATCSGTAGCTASCGVDCTATCNGTTECVFTVGNASEIVCNGTGGCDADCVGGGCRATCTGTNGCTLRCPLGGCDLICGVGAVTECADGVQVCGRACPTPAAGP